MEETWIPPQPARERRLSMRLIEPALQLRLPLYLFGLTLLFALLATAHSWYAYRELLANALPSAPEGYLELLGEQTWSFAGVSALLLAAYGLGLAGVCVAYLHRVVGPLVAFRRQIAALRRGDYAARNALREGSAFAELGADLNDLAQALQARREARLLDH